MSLIVAVKHRDCQLWLSDGRTVRRAAGKMEVQSETEPKIHQIPGRNWVIGCSGRMYDADFIRTRISGLTSEGSTATLLRESAAIVRYTNELSSEVNACSSDGHPGTGVMMGGFQAGEEFLAILTPDGAVFNLGRFGAIGSCSEPAATTIGSALSPSLDAGALTDLLISCYRQAAADCDTVNEVLFARVVSAQEVTDPLSGVFRKKQVSQDIAISRAGELIRDCLLSMQRSSRG